MSSAQQQRLGIKRIDSLHFFVRDLARSRDHYVRRLDFVERAVSGPAFEQTHGARASLLEAGEVRFVFIEPCTEESESGRWLLGHPEGVGRIVFEVEDAAHSYALLCARGATPVSGIVEEELETDAQCDAAAVRWFDIATAFGDTLFRFVERRGLERGVLPGMIRTSRAPAYNRFGISEIDHVTSNFLTLKPAILWMEQVLGFQRYWGIEFHTQDVSQETTGSGLKSIVMWDPASGIKLANNEPAAPAFHASQIYRFCQEHRGAGVQHVALAVHDIVSMVHELRARGVAFMPTPAAYYELLPRRLVELGVEAIEEDVACLRELEILVDGDGPQRYLLQIFLREAATLFRDLDAGPLFIELIQRKGDRGFGAGNFRALFESIERQQGQSRAA